MRVEVLYFDGCPTYVSATRNVSEVLSELGMEAEVEMVAVNSDEDAKRLRFPGSPTIRVDGRDLFPVPERGIWALVAGSEPPRTPFSGSPTSEN